MKASSPARVRVTTPQPGPTCLFRGQPRCDKSGGLPELVLCKRWASWGSSNGSLNPPHPYCPKALHESDIGAITVCVPTYSRDRDGATVRVVLLEGEVTRM